VALQVALAQNASLATWLTFTVAEYVSGHPPYPLKLLIVTLPKVGERVADLDRHSAWSLLSALGQELHTGRCVDVRSAA
jgi:hypothetical protein